MHFRSWEILEKLSHDYKQPHIKLKQMVKKGELIKVIRGLYEDNRNASPHLLAAPIYGPSYISFEYALSRYGLIKALRALMFEDLRIDEGAFNQLDKDKLFSLAALYSKKNLQLLTRMREP